MNPKTYRFAGLATGNKAPRAASCGKFTSFHFTLLIHNPDIQDYYCGALTEFVALGK